MVGKPNLETTHRLRVDKKGGSLDNFFPLAHLGPLTKLADLRHGNCSTFLAVEAIDQLLIAGLQTGYLMNKTAGGKGKYKIYFSLLSVVFCLNIKIQGKDMYSFISA